MTAYNKLKIAILAVFASQSIYAITIDPVQIQSAPGELLYAEMSFSQANLDLPMHVSLASMEDLLSVGNTAQPQTVDHLNFFVRRNNNGSGVITITSSQPYHAPELNIIIKVQEGTASQIKRVRSSLKTSTPKPPVVPNPHDKPLVPVRIVNESDIALNLPLSSSQTEPPSLIANTDNAAKTEEIPKTPVIKAENQAQAAAQPSDTPSTPTTAETTAPAPANAAQDNKNTAKIPGTLADPSQPLGGSTSIVTTFTETGEMKTEVVHSVVQDSPKMPSAKATETNNAAKAKKADTSVKAQKATPSVNKKATPSVQYSVQSKDSLWGIASRIAKEQNRSVQDVMEQIHQQNKQAFKNGDINRLQVGTVLNLGSSIPSNKTASAKKTYKPKQSSKDLAVKTAPVTKYKINQAEMSLVTEQEQVKNPSSAQKKANIPEQLSLNVMTTREKSVKLQRNVTNLELALRKKDQRLQLLNARLAELQQQLKAQQAKPKSTG